MCSILFYINVGYLKLDDIDQPISLWNNEVIRRDRHRVQRERRTQSSAIRSPYQFNK